MDIGEMEMAADERELAQFWPRQLRVLSRLGTDKAKMQRLVMPARKTWSRGGRQQSTRRRDVRLSVARLL